jgi:hypothetical protein
MGRCFAGFGIIRKALNPVKDEMGQLLKQYSNLY